MTVLRLSLASGQLVDDRGDLVHWLGPAPANGWVWLDLYPPEEQPIAEQLLSALSRDGCAGAVTHWRSCGKDETVPVDVRLARLPGSAEAEAIVIATNLRSEERQVGARQQSHVLERLATFADGLAHDLNNILVGVLGNASLIQHLVTPDSEVNALASGIERAAVQATEWTRQLLVYARGGKGPVERVNLNQAVLTSLGLLQQNLGSRVQVQCDLDPAVPDMAGNQTQLLQVVRNLVANAQDALGEAGNLSVQTEVLSTPQARALLIGPSKETPYVRLTIRDNGTGMRSDVLERAFEPFFSTRAKGRGLGLSTIYGICRAWGGEIQLDSAPGVGTTATVLLPIEPPPSVNPPVPASDNEASLRQGNGTVLVVDDEEIVLTLARTVLRRLGFDALCAKSGAEALEQLARVQRGGERIALVLLDATMADVDSIALLAKLRQIDPALRFLVSSGYITGPAIEELLAAGADGFIAKPYTVSALSAKINEVLRDGPSK